MDVTALALEAYLHILEASVNDQSIDTHQLLAFVKSSVLNAIRTGMLDVANKTDRELQRAVFSYIAEWGKEPVLTTHLNLNYTNELLDEALNAVERENGLLAIILYATWCEHWINGIITSIAQRQGMTGVQIEKLFKGNRSLFLKYTKVLDGLGLPRFDESIREALLKLAKQRNDFVHYKWESLIVDDLASLKWFEEIDQLLASMPANIEALKDYENHHIYFGVIPYIDRLFERLAEQLARQTQK
ncbi:hypothetical protein [Herpetosiphon geysericola]|uniref:Uncharacterized protein n=1 Tax=Herpetosiphon geysericola TaxID=70996 RepID=A0A0P6YS72_9CHLR|nr:hypothetical protein [Herpetosiphon geysericola]KPL86147.1 hypothetical protein SE18_14920 [Herpetosiphon geysericola]